MQLNLTPNPNNPQDYQPSISGTKIAFTSNRAGDSEVYVVDLMKNRCGR